MKFSERVKIWLGLKGEEVFKIEDTDVIKSRLDKTKESYKK